MANELILNVTLSETRVARLENGVVSELFIERMRDEGVVGNIYKGKVVRVLPGMQAAFIDIGLDRTAFLHASDVVEDFTRFEADIEPEKGEEKQEKKQNLFRPRRKTIDELLKEGRDILVQVEKEPMGTKGARLTSH